MNEKTLPKCKYGPCQNPVKTIYHKYCCNGHRKYAWKKRNWKRYLKWQRNYNHKKAKTSSNTSAIQ